VKAEAWRRHGTMQGDEPYVVELLECPWCMGVYVAGFVFVARRVAPRAWTPLARVLALSATTGLLTKAASDD
jgi:hypothetical protein